MHFSTIPIFIPGVACPNRCIYCNQQIISGQPAMPTEKEIIQTICRNLSTIPINYHKEIGFFGGTFTGLPLEEQWRLLCLVKPFVERGEVDGIRISTHPLCISPDIVNLLNRGGVRTVELGVQSFDDDVLKNSGRGYTAKQIYEAARSIKEAGLDLGMQMMVGLPGDTPEKCLETAKCIIRAGASNTRIYPTLVVQGTALASLYLQGKYTALSLEQAVEWTAPVLRLFQENNVAVLRVGLHPTEGFINGTDYMVGPFHVAFKELVQSEIWKEVFESVLGKTNNLKENNASWLMRVSPSQLNSAIGHKGSNKKMLLQSCRKVRFIPDNTLKNYECVLEKSDLRSNTFSKNIK
ncbi:MAG: radical SAM protein [Bacteroidales bacterium]|nr:radical SAM protein [Bacteroidales bacterium]